MTTEYLSRLLICAGLVSPLHVWAQDDASQEEPPASDEREDSAESDPADAVPAPDEEPRATPPMPSDTSPVTFPEPDVSGYLMTAFEQPKIQVNMFGYLGLTLSDNFQESELTVGQLVIHTAADLRDGFSSNTEITLDSTPEPQATVQRFLLHWEKNDALKISVGRYHLPLTWWNATAHHGLWLQTTTTRPRMLDYGNSLIPNHALGIFASGYMPVLEALGLRYHVSISGENDGHVHGTTDSVDTDHSEHLTRETSPSLNMLLAIEPPSIPFLQVGLSGFVSPHEDLHIDASTRILSSNVAYTSERPEVIVEGVLVSHVSEDASLDDASNNIHNSFAGYTQLAWRARAWGGRLKPYVRFEHIQLDAGDPHLQSVSDFSGLTGGLRTDLNPSVAVKIDTCQNLLLLQDSGPDLNLQVSAAW